MENVLHLINRLLFPADREGDAPVKLPTAEEELTLLKGRIRAAQSRFDAAQTDGEAEAAIYDLNALEVRYRLLLRNLKNP